MILDYLLNNPKVILDTFTYGIAIASIYVKLTPNKEDDEIFNKIMKVISLYKGK